MNLLKLLNKTKSSKAQIHHNSMSNKKNITYLLGAGASAKSLPTVAGLPDAIHAMKATVNNKSKVFVYDKSITGQEAAYLAQVIDELEYLYTISGTEQTIDSYAKTLYLRGGSNKELNRLKIILSIYFTLEQAYSPVDVRYRSFFQKILTRENDQLKLPANVNILSWNYDYQMELALSNIASYEQAKDLDDFINVYPRSGTSKLTPGFSLFKLNGSACSFSNDNGFERNILRASYKDVRIDGKISHLHINDSDERVLYKRIAQYYESYLKGAYPSMHFAWENDPLAATTRTFAKMATANFTQVLVVIGYSFPDFNDQIDRSILPSMKGLEKIYIQDPSDYVAERFQEIVPPLKLKNAYHDLVPVQKTNTDSFFIPSDL
ncbi:MAG: hypothetical protein JWM14_1496 [Chitinophagaceae bacterium]|nr:hypothetical protein [Chitinophagaceae bacterium]